MPEFLVRVDGKAKYVRVIARDQTEIVNMLKDDWSRAVAFSSRGQAFQLEVGRAPTPSRQRLPFAVWLAWLGVRFPRVRLAFQLACWLALGLILTIGASGMRVAPQFLVLTGLANVFAWWWSESERGRLEPHVRRTRAD